MKALPNYREHPRRKRILAIIAGAVAGVLLVAFLVFWLLGTPTNKIVPQYDPALAIPAQEAGACFTAADGTVYSLSKLWTLKSSGADGNHIISLFVFRMIPVNNGVAYIVIDKLYYYEKGERTKIAENVQTIAQYQSQMIYATADGNLYCWNGAESSLLVSSRDKSPHTFYMLGNADYLLIQTNDASYVYHQGELRDMDIGHSSSRSDFLYGEYLITLGAGAYGGVVYHLPDMEYQPLVLGWPTHESDNQISIAADGDAIYLSLSTTLWPFLGDEKHTGTFRLDPQDWHAEKLDEEYHPDMILGQNGLYFFSPLTQRGYEIMMLE